MELELIPRDCPFCHHKPDTHAYHDNNGRLNMYTIMCQNEYCMIQPMVQMYGFNSQHEAVKYWNGEDELPYA